MKCNICHKIGHTSNVGKAKTINDLPSTSCSGYSLNYADAKFNQISLKMLVDTGVIISAVSNKLFTDKL